MRNLILPLIISMVIPAVSLASGSSVRGGGDPLAVDFLFRAKTASGWTQVFVGITEGERLRVASTANKLEKLMNDSKQTPIVMVDRDLYDSSGASKIALFDLEHFKIEVTRSKWRALSDAEKYVTAALELYGLAQVRDRYGLAVELQNDMDMVLAMGRAAQRRHEDSPDSYAQKWRREKPRTCPWIQACQWQNQNGGTQKTCFKDAAKLRSNKIEGHDLIRSLCKNNSTCLSKAYENFKDNEETFVGDNFKLTGVICGYHSAWPGTTFEHVTIELFKGAKLDFNGKTTDYHGSLRINDGPVTIDQLVPNEASPRVLFFNLGPEALGNKAIGCSLNPDLDIVWSSIYFHTNGALKSCYNTQQRWTTRYGELRSSVMNFYDNGVQEGGYVDKSVLFDITVEGQRFKLEDYVAFYPNGNISEGRIAWPAKYAGKTLYLTSRNSIYKIE